MGWFSSLNPANYLNTMKSDLSGTPTWGKFWDSFGANDPLTHGLLNSQSRLDDNVTARGLGAIGLNGPAGYFQRAADDPTQGVLHHGLAGLAYLGGSALGGLGGASGAADGGSVNLFADAVPGAGGDVGASAIPSAAGTASGFGGVGTDPAVSGFNGPQLAGDNIDAGGGWNPASGGSSFNWQGMAKQFLTNGLKQQGQQAANRQGYQPSLYNSNSNGYIAPQYTPQQRIAQALMIPNMTTEGPAQSPMSGALLAQQLLK